MIRLPPPLWALVAALAQRALTRGAAEPSTPRVAVATTLGLASLGLAGASATQFARSGTTIEPFQPDRTTVLVTTGANSVTRNPMYVGMAGLLLAHAVRRGSWVALIPIAGFVVVIDRLQITTEEAALTATFGSGYDAYRARVPRWIGRRSCTAGQGS